MKILHIIASLDKTAGGPSRSVPQTCEQLHSLGCNIEIITRSSPSPVDIANNGFKVRFMSIPVLLMFGMRLKKTDYDIIHLQHVWDPYIHIMAWYARSKGIPYIITPRGMLEPWIMQRNPLKKKLAMWLYQRKDIAKATYLHATCHMERDNIRALGFENPIAVIPNGLNLDNKQVSVSECNNKRIVFLSRIHPKKGIELLLEAWQQIESDWQLDIAGDGDATYIQSIKELIISKNIKNVQVVGAKYGDEKWKFLQSADLFVLPTYSENFGIVVAEALYTGLPVITTTGTPWDELNSEGCGWWIELSVENLVQTLQTALALDKESLQSMGLKGRQLVEEKYDITKVAKDMKQLYEQILNK